MAVSVHYYVNVLGFANADWGSEDFTSVARDEAAIYLCCGGQGEGRTWVWIGVEDVEALYQEYKTSGAMIQSRPGKLPMGVRDGGSGPGWPHPSFWVGTEAGHSLRGVEGLTSLNARRNRPL